MKHSHKRASPQNRAYRDGVRENTLFDTSPRKVAMHFGHHRRAHGCVVPICALPHLRGKSGQHQSTMWTRPSAAGSTQLKVGASELLTHDHFSSSHDSIARTDSPPTLPNSQARSALGQQISSGPCNRIDSAANPSHGATLMTFQRPACAGTELTPVAFPSSG